MWPCYEPEVLSSGCIDRWISERVDEWTDETETCSGDISDDVKAVLVDGPCQWDGNAISAALWLEHGEHQALQVRPGFAAQLHKSPVLLVVGPVATGHLADDHVFRRRTEPGTAVLPQWCGRSNLRVQLML